MGQKTPDYKLEMLLPRTEKVETIKILRQTTKAATALAELKGIAKTIPNQLMLVNAIMLQEAKDSSEIENIITTQDELYKAKKIDFVVNQLQVERKAASRYLRELERIGVLKSQKIGRETLYINIELVEILKL